jgi:hypothetical protein
MAPSAKILVPSLLGIGMPLRLDGQHLARFGQRELPLADFYVGKTEDRVLTPQHGSTLHVPRLISRQSYMLSRIRRLSLAEYINLGEGEFAMLRVGLPSPGSGWMVGHPSL